MRKAEIALSDFSRRLRRSFRYSRKELTAESAEGDKEEKSIFLGDLGDLGSKRFLWIQRLREIGHGFSRIHRVSTFPPASPG
jgi:hypothetical protein